MEPQERKRKQHKKQHKKTNKFSFSVRAGMLLPAVVLGIMVLIASIAAGIALRHKAATVMEDTQQVMTDIGIEPETVEEESASFEGTEEQGTVIQQIAADVAATEDKEDPQNHVEEQEQGSAVNITADSQASLAQETNELTFGIDVAKYQGIIDWKQVRDAGMDFAMIRAGYRTSVTGIICEDPQAKYNMQEAQAAGLKIGVYFFSTAVTEAEAIEEANWLTGFIARYKITYPVVYNCENFTATDSRQNMLSKEERSNNAVAFLETVKAAGYTPMFYANKSEMENSRDWDMTLLSAYRIWTAYYPQITYPQLATSGYAGESMWQYTNRGRIAGVNSDVDLNVAYFGYAQEAQARDTTPAETVAANVEAHITFQEVNETVTPKVKINLRNVPSSDSPDTIIATITNDQQVVRTGIGSNGWSRILYEGQICYAVSSYLTTDLTVKSQEAPDSAGKDPVQTTESNRDGQEPAQAQTDNVYRQVNEQVTAKDSTNLRSSADRAGQDNIVGTLHYGEVLTRTGIGSNGWSVLSYNGQTVYAVSGYLTTNLEYQNAGRPTPENPDGNAIFTTVNEQVTAKSVTNLRSVASAELEETIVATIRNGEVVTRIATGSNGWSKVSYNGQTLYAITSYLVKVE